MTWDEEDEYIDSTGNETGTTGNGFGVAAEENTASKTLPEGVLHRIKMYAERTSTDIGLATKMYLDYIKDNFGCDDPYSEDEDLLIDWAESCFVETRKVRTGGKGATWVGSFIGVADKTQDRMKGLRNYAIREFTKDPTDAIQQGRIGVYEKGEGVWKLRTLNGVVATDYDSKVEPPHGFRADGNWIAFLDFNKENVTPSIIQGRYAYFLGNEEGEFVNNSNISLWRVDLRGEHTELSLDIGRPCKIQVKPPREGAPEQMKDIVTTFSNFEIDYTDSFVDDDVKPLLNPTYFWKDEEFHTMYVNLEELEEAYEAGSRSFEIDGRKVKSGPLVFTKGTISSMSTEPMDSEYDAEGFNYRMTLQSGIAGDIDCWIPGAVGKYCDPFTSGYGEDARAYAEKSTVFVFGRIGLKQKDGLTTPKMTVYGVYAHHKRCRWRADGGDTEVSQFE